MAGYLRTLAIGAALCAAGAVFGPALQGSATLASPPSARTKVASVPASSGGRIWYRAGQYPEVSLPDGRTEIVRSVLNIARPMEYGGFVWDDEGIPDGQVWVRVDLAHQILSVFRDGHEIGSAVLLYGDKHYPTPTGSFAVLSKDRDYYSHSYHAPMPYALRLTKDGVAIHGSNVREGWATHGCIGVPLKFARLLFSVVSKGDLVVVLPSKAAPQKA